MLLFIVISIISCVLVFKGPWFRVEGLSSKLLLSGFLLKCLAGFAMLWLYGQYIEIDRADADVFKYFDDAVVMQSSAQESLNTYVALFSGNQSIALASYAQGMYNWEHSNDLIYLNDNRTMIRFHSLLLFISRGDIRIHQIIFSLISFLGLVLLFKGFSRWTPLPGWSFLLVCILPFSLCFWGSGLLKEALVMLPVGLTIFGLAGWQLGWKRRFLFLLGAILFLGMKPYVGLCLVPSIMFLFLSERIPLRGSLVITFIGTVLALYLSGFSTSIDIISILSAKQEDFYAMAVMSDAGSVIGQSHFSDVLSFLMQAPRALFLTLFRPGLWEVRGLLDGIASMENGIYLLLILVAILYRRSELNMRAIIFSLIFIVCLGVLVGSVTPVLGAVVRYKVPMLPFLMFVLFQVIDLSRFPLTRKLIQ